MILLRWGHLFVKSMCYKNPDIQHRNLEIHVSQSPTAPLPHRTPHTRFSNFCIQKAMLCLCSNSHTAVNLLKIPPPCIRSNALDLQHCLAIHIVVHISKRCSWCTSVYIKCVGWANWSAAFFVKKTLFWPHAVDNVFKRLFIFDIYILWGAAPFKYFNFFILKNIALAPRSGQIF